MSKDCIIWLVDRTWQRVISKHERRLETLKERLEATSETIHTLEESLRDNSPREVSDWRVKKVSDASHEYDELRVKLRKRHRYLLGRKAVSLEMVVISLKRLKD